MAALTRLSLPVELLSMPSALFSFTSLAVTDSMEGRLM